MSGGGFFVRTARGLEADDDRAHQMLKGIKIGTIVACGVSRPRNVKLLRKFWSLCSRIAHAVPGDMTAENVAEILKIESGHCTIIKGRTDTYRLPKSIAFDAMAEDEFQDFYGRCEKVVLEVWLPHLKGDVSELRKMLGLDPT